MIQPAIMKIGLMTEFWLTHIYGDMMVDYDIGFTVHCLVHWGI